MQSGPHDPAVMRDIINLELAAHGVKARAVIATDAPQCWTFVVRTAFGGRVEQVERLQASVAEKCGVAACRIDRADHGLIVQLAKPPAARAVVSARSIARLLVASGAPRRASLVPVGISSVGHAVFVDMRDPAFAHIAIFGITGAGKTTLMRWIAWWLALDNQPRLLVASPKREDWAEFAGKAALLHPPVLTEHDFACTLEWLSAEMQRRAGAEEQQEPLIFLVDEVPYWLARVPRANQILEQVAAQGRGLRVHLVLGSQRADEASVGRAAFNAACRIVGRLGSGVYAFPTAGRGGTEATALLGAGDMLMVAPKLERFQAPLLAAGDFQRLPPGCNSIDLPEPVMMVARNARASDIDEAEVAAALQSGASIRQVMAQFRISFARAKAIQEAYT